MCWSEKLNFSLKKLMYMQIRGSLMNKMAKRVEPMQIWLLPLTQTVVANIQILILLNRATLGISPDWTRIHVHSGHPSAVTIGVYTWGDNDT